MEERTTNSNRQQRRAVCYEQGRGRRRRRERDVMKEKVKHRRDGKEKGLRGLPTSGRRCTT